MFVCEEEGMGDGEREKKSLGADGMTCTAIQTQTNGCIRKLQSIITVHSLFLAYVLFESFLLHASITVLIAPTPQTHMSINLFAALSSQIN